MFMGIKQTIGGLVLNTQNQKIMIGLLLVSLEIKILGTIILIIIDD
tara:strand:+ start:1356 stop:1493 length:138 start_codon:yes stop_codon:yes gene_type:complete